MLLPKIRKLSLLCCAALAVAVTAAHAEDPVRIGGTGNYGPVLPVAAAQELKLFDKLGVTRGRRSLYDEMMLSLHDAAKRDAAYQANAPHTALEFPPGSCWLVYTDQVLHAAMKGEFALEQTFHFDVDQMGEPDTAPIRVLEKITGRSLA